MPFKKILIANRGEIACRIARTCRRLGIGVAGVHSEADRNALHVREIGESIEIGPAPASASYLQIERIVEAARRVGADAVHPGYGFLAENAALASALAEAGIAFIGPRPEVLRQFGDKAAAKAVARGAGVPVVPGTIQPSRDPSEILSALRGMQLPVLLKAAAGGGGKGMRVVSSLEDAAQEIQAAMREGQSSFGNPELIVEEFLPRARHIEVQILGDGRGRVIHLFDRECSLQRRHQKVIEEAPVLSLPVGLREEILGHAVRLGEAVRYGGLGTVEFIVQGRRAFFLEVNPRIQVEHPVTEEVTGLDLVELQLRAVGEAALPRQDEIRVTGCAIEARLYAEDTARGFLPSTGTVERLRLPGGIRVDAGVDEGAEVTPFYDPMIAKLIATGPDRAGAYAALRSNLAETGVLGLETNRDFLLRLATDPDVLRNEVHTGSIDALLQTETARAGGSATTEDAALAAALWLRKHRAESADPWSGWSDLTGWRLGDGSATMAFSPSLRLLAGEESFEATFGQREANGSLGVRIGEERFTVTPGEAAGRQVSVLDGRSCALRSSVADESVGFVAPDGRSVRFRVEPHLSGNLLASEASGDGRIRAPMMGRIVAVEVEAGTPVTGGQRLATMESMKMELPIQAPWAGVVSAVHCRQDANVERDQVVFVLSRVEDAAA
ncbi:acetyl/propionyl/methylcrotonyl-CoA carboxylase subunit alpha [Enterovirga sp. CN4-39]|uniref:acetyl/propionyl/methylcrotonyl-CoA carboxylase subunit alpha n=1 Tax=Enterovirga sp. CN4-39 TaxID=3400910 RepID=UPI003C019F14